MKTDNSWDRYHDREDSPGRKRYDYAVSHLFGSVLDVGCGDGFGMYLMNKNIAVKSVTGIDIQAEAVEKAKTNLHGLNLTIVKADAENIPFHNNSFDCVFCGQTLEHVKDDRKVINEIRRVIKRRVVFSVPINGGISQQHVREYKSEKEFIDLISQYFKTKSTRIFNDGKYKRLVVVAEK